MIVRWEQPLIIKRRKRAIVRGGLDKFLRSNPVVEGSLADILLSVPNSLIVHVDPKITRTGDFVNRSYLSTPLLGQNYNDGIDFQLRGKIIVQRVWEKKGPWVLFRPPGEDYKTFHLMNTKMKGVIAPEFQRTPDFKNFNGNIFVYTGDPNQIFADFEKVGYSFSNEEMPDKLYDNYEELIIRTLEGS